MYVRPTKWPKVVGGISILFGLSAPLRVFRFLAVMALGKARRPAFRLLPQWSLYYAGAASFVLTVLLLLAGIALVKRRKAGWTLHIACALMWIVHNGVALTALGISVSRTTGPTWLPLGIFSFATTEMAYPVFLLVWLSRRRIREEVAVWRERTLARRRRLAGQP